MIRPLVYMFLILVLLAACKDTQQASQMPPPEIPVIETKQADVPVYTELVGQIYGLKDIPIRARVDGYIKKISFEEGSSVKQGQLLYFIDPDPMLAEVAAKESSLAEAQTRMVNAKNELDRYIPLAEMKAVSQSDLDAAQANYDASIANVEAAKANLRQARIRLGYCSIEAPIDGLIGATEAREGEYVGRDPNPVILNTLSRIDTVRVQFSISEGMYLEFAKARVKARGGEDAEKVREDQREESIQLILADGSLFEEKGTFDFVNSQINPTTGSLLAQASFPNPDGILRPGLYAKVRVEIRVAEDAIVIPQRCLLELQGQFSVMVTDENNAIASRPVTIGQKMGDLVIIEEGLSSGEKVVIDALQKVRPGMTVQPVPTNFQSKTTL